MLESPSRLARINFPVFDDLIVLRVLRVAIQILPGSRFTNSNRSRWGRSQHWISKPLRSTAPAETNWRGPVGVVAPMVTVKREVTGRIPDRKIIRIKVRAVISKCGRVVSRDPPGIKTDVRIQDRTRSIIRCLSGLFFDVVITLARNIYRAIWARASCENGQK